MIELVKMTFVNKQKTLGLRSRQGRSHMALQASGRNWTEAEGVASSLWPGLQNMCVFALVFMFVFIKTKKNI